MSLEDYEVNELIRISQQSSPPPAIVPGVVPGSVAAGSLGKHSNLHLTEEDEVQTFLGFHSEKTDACPALKKRRSWSVAIVSTLPSLLHKPSRDLWAGRPKVHRARGSRALSPGWGLVGLVPGTLRRKTFSKIYNGHQQ